MSTFPLIWRPAVCLCLCSLSWVLCAALSSNSTPPLHTSQQIRGLGERSRSYQPALHSCCFDTGGAPQCLSIIIVYPLLHLQTFSNPPVHTHTTLLPILPQLRGILQVLWTMFHFFTGTIFDSLMAPTKRKEHVHRETDSLPHIQLI